jgi:hypothetical protein
MATALGQGRTIFTAYGASLFSRNRPVLDEGQVLTAYRLLDLKQNLNRTIARGRMTCSLTSMKWRIVLIFLLSGLLGCVSTPDEQWVVQTEPPGATVTLSTGQSCPVTPCSILITTGENFDVTIEKPGYQTVRAKVVRRVRSGDVACVVAILIIGGMAGGAGSGSECDISSLVHPNPFRVELTPIRSETLNN